MTGIVLPRRSELTSTLAVGAPVQSRDWYSAAALANWLRGTGAELVPLTSMRTTLTAGSSSFFQFYTKTRHQCAQRVWIVIATAATTSQTARFGFRESGEANYTFATAPGREDTPSGDNKFVTFIYTRNVTSTNARAVLVADIRCESDSNSSLIVRGIACYEQARPLLTTGETSSGVDLYSCSTRQPIYLNNNRSVNAVERVMLDNGGDCRRVGLFHWTRGSVNPITYNSATPVNLLAFGSPILTRKLGTAATTNPNIFWSALCYSIDGSNTNITLNYSGSAGSSSDSVTVTNLSSSWLTPRNITFVDCENLSISDGRRGSVWSTINFSFSVASPAEFSGIVVLAISVWEE